MKVALVNPPMDFDVSLGRAKGIAKYTAMAPLGLAYIAAVLRTNGIDVSIIDAYAKGLNIFQIVDEIIERKADIVGINCVTPAAPIVYRIADKIKSVDKEKFIVVGGPHVSVLPEEALNKASIDVVIRGEGETTVLELVQCLDGSRDLSTVLGISFRKGNKVVHNWNRDFIGNLDSIPRPAYDLLPLHLYKAPPHWAIDEPVFGIFATRGCPFHCSFCAAEVIGKKRRLRGIDNVLDEIEYLSSEYKAKQIMFQDTCFPFERRHALELINGIIDRGFHKRIVWTTSSRVDLVDKELLDNMYQSGCRIINFGIESGVQSVLDNVHKGFTLEKVRKGVELTRKAGIKIFATFILGLPGDSHETCRKTIEFAKDLDVDFAQFFTAVPYPGTDLWREYLEDRNSTFDWIEFLQLTAPVETMPVYIPKGMTAQELKELQRAAYKEFYLRPSRVWRYLSDIKSFKDVVRYWDVAKVLLNF